MEWYRKNYAFEKLIPALCARGIRPGLIKHTHHDMDVDKPGKDSYELRKAGAAQTIVASQQRWALMTETPDEEELDLHFLASRMDTSKLDLILVEGFKHEEIAKIVLFRDGAGHRPEELVIDRHVIAVASDVPLNLESRYWILMMLRGWLICGGVDAKAGRIGKSRLEQTRQRRIRHLFRTNAKRPSLPTGPFA